MIHAGVPGDIHQRAHRAGFGVARPEHQRANSPVHHRACAHDAGLKRDIQRGIQQTVVLQHQPALAQRHNLRVRGGIVTANRAIPAFANDLIIVYQHRAYRHFTLVPGALRQRQGVAHPVFMGEFSL